MGVPQSCGSLCHSTDNFTDCENTECPSISDTYNMVLTTPPGGQNGQGKNLTIARTGDSVLYISSILLSVYLGQRSLPDFVVMHRTGPSNLSFPRTCDTNHGL